MSDKADPNNTERNDPNAEAYRAALKRERAHYLSTGNTERLAAVDRELGKLEGDPVERAVAAPAESSEPVKAKPARRKPATRKAKG